MKTTVLDHIVTATEAKPVGSDRWSGHCPSHGSQRHQDLSITLTGARILVHCFAGCLTPTICHSLGLELRDLFTDALDPDPQRQKAAAQERERQRKQKVTEARRHGRRIDALRQADYFVRSRRGMYISQWTNQKLDDELNVLVDAYALLASEDRDG